MYDDGKYDKVGTAGAILLWIGAGAMVVVCLLIMVVSSGGGGWQ